MGGRRGERGVTVFQQAPGRTARALCTLGRCILSRQSSRTFTLTHRPSTRRVSICAYFLARQGCRISAFEYLPCVHFTSPFGDWREMRSCDRVTHHAKQVRSATSTWRSAAACTPQQRGGQTPVGFRCLLYMHTSFAGVISAGRAYPSTLHHLERHAIN